MLLVILHKQFGLFQIRHGPYNFAPTVRIATKLAAKKRASKKEKMFFSFVRALNKECTKVNQFVFI